LTQKKVTKKIPIFIGTRLYENCLFSTDRLCHATQAAPSHRPAHASVSLARGLRNEPSLENHRSFHNVGPRNDNSYKTGKVPTSNSQQLKALNRMNNE